MRDRPTLHQLTILDAQPAPAFACDGCGACCRTYPIFASSEDARREPRVGAEGRELPPHLATPEWTYQLYPLPFHATCCFLDREDRCTIYATRPAVCGEFEAGTPRCQEARARQGLPPLGADTPSRDRG